MIRFEDYKTEQQFAEMSTQTLLDYTNPKFNDHISERAIRELDRRSIGYHPDFRFKKTEDGYYHAA